MAKKRHKGLFGRAKLPISTRYLFPASRQRQLLLGAALAVSALIAAAVAFSLDQTRFVTQGPLSSSHAGLENSCDSCHTPFAEMTSQPCSLCHEKFGDEVGVFSFDAHYLYRTGDFQRVVRSEKEQACAACHPEHGGRMASITQVPDQQCRSCHDFGGFVNGHPEFLALAQPELANLSFSHIHHVREVMKENGFEDVEKACLSCHHIEPDGKQFQPINFETHCDSCHLTTAITTPRLPIQSEDQLGVLTLAGIQDQGEPGGLWSFFSNPNEFRVVGDRFVSKSPLHHEDPWVMDNLRRLRKMLYPDAGLADLLNASADVPPEQVEALYREAVETLRGYLMELRARPEPEIQQELGQMEALLAQVENELEDPYAALDELAFFVALHRDGEQVENALGEEIHTLVQDLTEACRVCHTVENATIARVQAGQGTFHRAEFNHSTHIIQRRCLDCHNQIPIREFLTGDNPVPPELDQASILNLPDRQTCIACHNQTTSADNCITCHQFHPDKTRHANLLLYAD